MSDSEGGPDVQEEKDLFHRSNWDFHANTHLQDDTRVRKRNSASQINKK